MNLKDEILEEIEKNIDDIVKMTVDMVQIPSETPPSDTIMVIDKIYEMIKDIPGIDIKFYTKEEPVKNMVAVIRSGKPGKRLVFSGHCDTYPIGEESNWNENPFSGSIKDGFIYGRGSSDMKAGIACFIQATKSLAKRKDAWSGEIVLAIAGDEESMGDRGAEYLLRNVDDVNGDAMICADVGAPNSLRFGQKGFIWFELKSLGKSAHGAHLHKGENAVIKLMKVIDRFLKEIPELEFAIPNEINEIIEKSADISEIGAGSGERYILRHNTVNIGMFKGGTSPNLVPEIAIAQGDIRIAPGMENQKIVDKINEIILSFENVECKISRNVSPNWSDINDPIFKIVKENSEKVLGEEVVVTFRIGASDSRLYRLINNIPTINCGLTPYSLGGPNEHVSINEMIKISQIHALSALDYLQ